MRVVERDGQTVISLGVEEMKELCKPGEGADTCIWVLVSKHGFECSYYNRPTGLAARWIKRQTVAQRDGCQKVKEMGHEVKYVEVETLADVIEGVTYR